MRLHDAHEAHDRRRRPSGCRRRAAASGRSRAPACAEVAHVAGLEAGVARAGGDRRCASGSPASPPPGGDRRLLGGGDRGVVGVAQDEIGEARRPARSRRRSPSPSAAAGWRAPGPRCASVIRTAVRSRSGSCRRPRAAKGATAATAVGPPCSSHSPISGVPEAEHASRAWRRGSRRTARRRRSSSRPRRATAAIAPRERRIGHDVEGEHRQAPAAQRRGRLQPGRRRVGGRRRERRGETGVLGHPETSIGAAV